MNSRAASEAGSLAVETSAETHRAVVAGSSNIAAESVLCKLGTIGHGLSIAGGFGEDYHFFAIQESDWRKHFEDDPTSAALAAWIAKGADEDIARLRVGPDGFVSIPAGELSDYVDGQHYAVGIGLEGYLPPTLLASAGQELGLEPVRLLLVDLRFPERISPFPSAGEGLPLDSGWGIAVDAAPGLRILERSLFYHLARSTPKPAVLPDSAAYVFSLLGSSPEETIDIDRTARVGVSLPGFAPESREVNLADGDASLIVHGVQLSQVGPLPGKVLVTCRPPVGVELPSGLGIDLRISLSEVGGGQRYECYAAFDSGATFTMAGVPAGSYRVELKSFRFGGPTVSHSDYGIPTLSVVPGLLSRLDIPSNALSWICVKRGPGAESRASRMNVYLGDPGGTARPSGSLTTNSLWKHTSQAVLMLPPTYTRISFNPQTFYDNVSGLVPLAVQGHVPQVFFVDQALEGGKRYELELRPL